MRIGVFGLGYVGCVTGACLARLGHEVCGVDISPAKVRMVNEGRSPIVERGMVRLVSRMVRARRLRASLEPADGVVDSDLSLVCVGTPSRGNGSVNLDHVLHAVTDIGRALRSLKRFHTVVVRSTIPPGTMEQTLIPTLERNARKRAGRDFGVCFQPEFLREGSSVHDFFHPPKTVIGTFNARSARRPLKLWKPIKAPIFVTSLKVAEMVKYADNAFHALKICFANEVGALSKQLGVDSHEVMRIFTRDRKLNISPRYLWPGFAFGGPCLPKDVRGLCWMGRTAGVEIPLLRSVLDSNRSHLDRAVRLILATGKKRLGILGLAFKSDTDDLRESPACGLVKNLLRAKREVKIYDPEVHLVRLIGANRAFVDHELPELPSLLVPSWRDVLGSSEVIVVTRAHEEFENALRKLKRNQIVVDLVRLPASILPRQNRSLGLCW